MVSELDEIKDRILAVGIIQEVDAQEIGTLKGEIDAQYSITRPL